MLKTRTHDNNENIRIERHEYIRHNNEFRSQSMQKNFFLLEEEEV